MSYALWSINNNQLQHANCGCLTSGKALYKNSEKQGRVVL